MGIDLAEVCMDIEDAFGIRLPDNGYDQPATVGGIIAVVRRLLGPVNRDTLVERQVFLRLQRAIAALPDGPPRLRPSDPVTLSTAGPLDGSAWAERWRDVELAAGLELPRLQRRAGCLIAGLLLIGLGIAVIFLDPLYGLPVLGLGWVLASARPDRALMPFTGTMGELTRAVLTGNVRRIARQHGPFPDRLVERMVIEIIAHRLNKDPATVTPASRLVQDLGAD